MLNSRNILLFALVASFAVSAAIAQRPQRPFQRRPQRAPDKLKEGDKAPDFTLSVMDGKKDETVTLSDFQGERPVALIFGSYT